MARNSFGGRHGGQDKTLLFLLIGIFFILVVILLAGVFYYITVNDASKNEAILEENAVELKKQMVTVLLPLTEIQIGTKLTPQFFTKEEREAVKVDERAINSFESINNMYATKVLYPGNVLLQDQISNVRPNSNVSTEIPNGFRAVTINVNATSSVEGWAKPGSKVDVNWTTIKNGRQVLRTIVWNAKVLSAERQVSNVSTGAVVPNTITLLVSARDAQKILLAQASSKESSLSLSLRGDVDTGKTEVGGQGISIDELLGEQQRKNNTVTVPDTVGKVIIDGTTFLVTKSGKMIPES